MSTYLRGLPAPDGTWKPRTAHTYCHSCGTARNFTEGKCDHCAAAKPRLVYDQETQHIIDTVTRNVERIAVVEQAQASYALALQSIRDNRDLDPALDALLGTMQDTFDSLAAIAKAVVA